uniref:Uncharacterized protein n=1 Tax=Chromera velia CCMP2878 TaxID=1169474 RepID=A0A0G4I4Z2_9ALVE|eukprot:Cvel_35857.t1-p1 / transcript=Cvel_35857.t1 / gene=Cvel_35857 / organism=Chromera_velia_CCMP2878 / gene_product=hypothetical protein / transcript_product=hypothetical protein / location=Cvel_scaffold6752:1347-1682(+) / protein_length=112 / sequence_SO=supercontig / SO=protein_coding / is_pseudo=false
MAGKGHPEIPEKIKIAVHFEETSSRYEIRLNAETESFRGSDRKVLVKPIAEGILMHNWATWFRAAKTRVPFIRTSTTDFEKYVLFLGLPEDDRRICMIGTPMFAVIRERDKR